MDTGSVPAVKDLVLVGGGHSHIAVLKRFGMRPLPGVRLTLICRDTHAPYSGMLPGLIAGLYQFDEAHIDLVPLVRFARARFVHGEAEGLDLDQRRVLCRDRPPIAYDLLSLDIGSTPSLGEVPGAAGRVVPLKPIDGFVGRWDEVLARVRQAKGGLRIAVVGGGAGGVEVLLAAQHRLNRELAGVPDARPSEFCLYADGPEILPTHHPAVRRIFRRVLAERGVAVRAGHRVAAVEPGRLIFAGGASEAFDVILWATHAAAAPWLKGAGLKVDPAGFIEVAETLQSVSHPGVFAAGDIAATVGHPRPKAGVFAVRHGRPLAGNLRRALLGLPLRPYRPQSRFLSLISTGDQYAVASRARFVAEGRWVWRWKNAIDRRFMRKYNELPTMAEEPKTLPVGGLADESALRELSVLAMRCGGCGAKIGSDLLARVLGRIDTVKRTDVTIGLEAPDDAAVVVVPPGRLRVETVDFFRAFIDDPYVFGQIAANHALSDIYAMGAEPQTALAIAAIPFGLEGKMEEQLFQLMAGAVRVLNEAGVALVGGHTGEALELALGFAVGGLARPDQLLRKKGLRPGDRLVLTKAIGTGTLFAAEMRGKAKGRWIERAIASMLQSNASAVAVLRAHGVSACTDVTGFGLLGHLLEMTKASHVDAELDLNAVPVLPGALECVAQGIFSSLQPQNIRLRRALKDPGRLSAEPRYALLFDPQTSGGLLAGVPEHAASGCVEGLRAAGYDAAAVIGRVLPLSDALEPIRLARP